MAYVAIHWFITSIRCLFSRAAATRSLSASCLLTANSEECVPGVISTTTLNRGGRARSSLTRIDNPISVAMLQWGIVGVKLIFIAFVLLSNVTRLSSTTCNSSKVRGCSGSLITRMRSEIRPQVNQFLDTVSKTSGKLPNISLVSKGSGTSSSSSAPVMARSSHFLKTLGFRFSSSILARDIETFTA